MDRLGYTAMTAASRTMSSLTVRATVASPAGTTFTRRGAAAGAASVFWGDTVAGTSCWQPASAAQTARSAIATRRRGTWEVAGSGRMAARGARAERVTTLIERIGHPGGLGQHSGTNATMFGAGAERKRAPADGRAGLVRTGPGISCDQPGAAR